MADVEFELVLVTLLGLAGLIVAIFSAASLSNLRVAIADLKRRLTALEGNQGTVATAAKPAVATPAATIPPPIPPELLSKTTPTPPRPVHSTPLNWESILGVKLFAWLGGFALFLGVVFFVKYAFERNLITPATRVISGGLIGVALIIIGTLPSLRRYRVPAQSLCATGILCLYASVYCAAAFYHLIPLTAASVLMWIVTGTALFLATRVDAQSVAWLGLVGGFATPFLVDAGPTEALLLLIYIAVLDCAIAAVAVAKRWTYLLVPAAIGSAVLIFTWQDQGQNRSETARILFLAVEGLFLGLCTATAWRKPIDYWTVAAFGIAAVTTLLDVAPMPSANVAWDLGRAALLCDVGVIAFASLHRHATDKAKAMATLVGVALALTWLLQWSWYNDIVATFGVGASALENDAAWQSREYIGTVIARHVELFLLFVATPYLAGSKRFWPWFIAALAGPLQFWFVHAYAVPPVHLVQHAFLWLLPLAFALPPAFGVWYLTKREGVTLSSGDSRLASQGAAVLAFVSLIFPVQFDHEWITLGWSLEGVALILLFYEIPNRRLRAAALILFAAAFIRLALNPAVLSYHPRTHVPILNWYFYTYGLAALCFFFGGHWFGQSRERNYEKKAPALLYTLAGVVTFLLMNIEIADYFSIGPTLTFSFSGNFARDMSYTIAWALFALGLLGLGIGINRRPVRIAGIALLAVALAKLFLHDLDTLGQLYRIGAFFAVAIIAIVASFAYQRFLSPKTEKS